MRARVTAIVCAVRGGVPGRTAVAYARSVSVLASTVTLFGGDLDLFIL